MTTNLRRRLWSQIWDSANVLSASATARPRLAAETPSSTLIYRRAARRAFSQQGHNVFPQHSPRITSHITKRQLSSSGLLLFGVAPSPGSSSSTLSTCTSAAEKSIYTSNVLQSSTLQSLQRLGWRRELHSGPKSKTKVLSRRNKSSTTNPQNGKKETVGAGKGASETAASVLSSNGIKKAGEAMAKKVEPGAYLKLSNLPKMPHAPTKEELLAAATGFWSRLKVRFKWFSIRSVRPWNVDDWSAFVSWFFLGHLVWILVGTTTFFSLLILAINTVVAQETLARWVGDYLTQSAGIKVVFESAIVPKWRDGVITLQNVFVSRRPGQGKSKVSKGSSSTAAAAAAALAEREADEREAVEDTNYTQFDVTIDTVNITLSFVKWWNGKGMLGDVEIKGIRGVVDRTSVLHVENVDPKSYRHEHMTGDFEIDSFKMEDLLLTIHQPGGMRPYSASIFSCELPQLRKQWLFYDFLSANHMSGAFDGSLFTIHPRQTHGFAGSQAANEVGSTSGANPWKKHSRLRIDGLKIDHLNRGVEGPFSWIHEGNVDIVADIMLPADNDESIAKVVSDFYDRMEATVTTSRYINILENHPVNQDLNTPERRAVLAAQQQQRDADDRRFLVMDLRVHLNDVRAAVPLFASELSYINSALIRPIVAYINSKKTFIPINCRIVKRASEFDGSWTIFDSGLMDDLSAEAYDAFAKDVVDSQARMRRLKKVGIWSISLAVQALFMGMAGGMA